MQERKTPLLDRDWFWITLMGIIVIGFCGKLLFTDQIIRASDVITQFFWGAKGIKEQSLLQYIQSIPSMFQASWEPLNDGGRTLEGGVNVMNLLFYRYVIQHFFPFPASIAWLAVISLLWGGIGTYYYCRLIGIGRFGSFTAGIIFALCTENASLINAGHIQKIETLSWAPWVFLYLEKSLRSGRLFHFAMAAMMLGLQFFNMHWQISFYTCLAVGIYWFFHVGSGFVGDKAGYFPRFRKDLLLTVIMVALFFTTIAMSFAPLVSWSQQSERGDAVATGTTGRPSSSAEKGIGYEEGMSWSMPPEELLTFVVPGLVGFSRQEGGDVPAPGQVYYWGRMRFTQTSDYLGLLPWLMLPLPLIFRRDRYTWLFFAMMGVTLIMALGKYTPIYPFMFEHLPAFSKFRVPKMILFLFAFAVAVLTGRGVDILAGEGLDRKKLAKWICWSGGVAATAAFIWLIVRIRGDYVIALAGDVIGLPTRYQSGATLVLERVSQMLRESAVAFGVACLYFGLFVARFKRWLPSGVVLSLLLILLLGDLWRVNRNFFVVTPSPPASRKAAKNDIVNFIEPRIDHYRMQPLNDENSHYYSDNGLANISAYVTISERRYKQFLDGFNLAGPMPDIMNLKYLLMPAGEYEAQKGVLTGKYMPVFSSMNGSVVLENRNVMPKAWLVPSVAVVEDPLQRVAILSTQQNFNPAQLALVESEPLLPMAPFPANSVGSAAVSSYEPNRIVIQTGASANALLVLGEKYYRWWYAAVDGKKAEIVPVNHILRGVYIPPGNHTVEFRFDPLPFKIGKWLTLGSFAFFAFMLGMEWRRRRQGVRSKE